MTTFYICRHGETENNKHHRLSGWVDSPLTTQGRLDAANSAAKLKRIKPDLIVSSDLGRAYNTAQIIAHNIGYQGEIVRSEGLREVNYGDLGGQPYSCYPSGLSPLENADYEAPNGESLVQMQARVLSCLSDLSVDYPNKTLLLVAHDGTINAIRARFKHENMGLADQTRNPHDTLVKFTIDNGTISAFATA